MEDARVPTMVQGAAEPSADTLEEDFLFELASEPSSEVPMVETAVRCYCYCYCYAVTAETDSDAEGEAISTTE